MTILGKAESESVRLKDAREGGAWLELLRVGTVEVQVLFQT